MLVDMITMDMVHMAVVQIVLMIVMLDRFMTTAGVVSMVMLSLMYFVCHGLTSMCLHGNAVITVPQDETLSVVHKWRHAASTWMVMCLMPNSCATNRRTVLRTDCVSLSG
jgi:hypothetical protein